MDKYDVKYIFMFFINKIKKLINTENKLVKYRIWKIECMLMEQHALRAKRFNKNKNINHTGIGKAFTLDKNKRYVWDLPYNKEM
jgi:hypothetical protein